MPSVLKTSYDQDIDIATSSRRKVQLGLLLMALCIAPWLLPNYWLSQLSFVLIYGIVGLGIMLLTGYTGLISLGHAAFLGVGAYTEAILTARGLPFPVSMLAAALLSSAVGVVVGLPALRLKGIYLGMATLSFAIIVEELIARWESVTGGNAGLSVSAPQVFGWKLGTGTEFYLLCLSLTSLSTWTVLNLLRSSHGRAFIAIRDSEVSAQSMGIRLAKYKTTAFALSAALTGLGGALYAHKVRFLSPEQFGIHQSIDLLLLVIIGGLGSVYGAFLGSLFLITLPQLISVAKDFLPEAIGKAAGLQSVVYGVILICFLLFEPRGIYGRWLKVRTWFAEAPFHRAGSFKRQRSFHKSEGLR